MPGRKTAKAQKTVLALALGRVLRKEREKVGLSQEAFSELVSLSKNYVGNLERGEDEASLSVLHRVARSLKRNASDFLKESGY